MEYTKEQYLADLQEMKSKLEAEFETKANAKTAEMEQKHEQQINELKAAIDEAKNIKPEVTAEELKAFKDAYELDMKAIEKSFARVKAVSNSQPQQKEKTFNEILAETIEANADQIKNFKKGTDQKSFEMKAVGDMSISANFTTPGAMLVDVRNTLVENPYNRVWLGDILPGGTSNGNSILYPKENGAGEGGAAAWTDKTADKAQMDFDLIGTSAYFKWLAGIVIIEREMLDDIVWLTSYLQSKMLISLKTAENDFILNGTSDTNPVQGLLDAATAYSNSSVTYTAPVDKIIDAAYGQIIEGTNEFYSPTHTVLYPRDAVAIGLNKATGSGEYDLPQGSVAFANGRLSIGGLTNVTTTQIGSGNFLTFDNRATMFIKRMQPELRMFEDATLAKKNKVMFRIEERATLAIFNNAAIISGTL